MWIFLPFPFFCFFMYVGLIYHVFLFPVGVTNRTIPMWMINHIGFPTSVSEISVRFLDKQTVVFSQNRLRWIVACLHL
jgi:hypothetical protein